VTGASQPILAAGSASGCEVASRSAECVIGSIQLPPTTMPATVLEDSQLPTGAVTFLFTDIEGSTMLWEQHPDAMLR
jgi:class 3 adenylate cyclase